MDDLEDEHAAQKRKLSSDDADQSENKVQKTESIEEPTPNSNQNEKGAGDEEKNSEMSKNGVGSSLSEPQKLLDPLSYTQGEEFTSEIYKIQIHNLPNKYGFGDLKKRLKSSLGLNPHKIKCPFKQPVAYVCFRNETDRQEALVKINGHVWKGKTLDAKIAAPAADPYLQRHQGDRRSQGTESKNSKKKEPDPVEKLTLTPEQAEERLKANICPLWNTDYSEQLRIKTEKMREVFTKVTKHPFVKHMFKSRSGSNEPPCPLDPIIPSPVTSEYRNKNEFTIGYGLDGKTLTVGFRYGMYKDGTTSVGDCTNLNVIMPAALPVVQSFTQFLKTSKWLPFQQQTATGHWQTLTVRTFRHGDVLAMVDFVPRKLRQEDIDEVKAAIQQYYTSGDGSHVKITSFYFRTASNMGAKGASKKTEHLFGEGHVYEQLLGLKFRISPEAFFQINTLATEKLYNLIAEWSGVTENTTVLDVCCGTGTIGLSLAKKVKSIVGIEMCKEAIDDAQFNASINDIKNATFRCAKVEDVIASTLSSIPSGDVVAIVDPPRAGLHKSVIKTLRRSTDIKRLVYVSCNPNNAWENFVDLIRPSTGYLKGPAFNLVKAIPVDLFPGTVHCELVILFTRDDDEHGNKDNTQDRQPVDEQAGSKTQDGETVEEESCKKTEQNEIIEEESCEKTEKNESGLVESVDGSCEMGENNSPAKKDS